MSSEDESHSASFVHPKPLSSLPSALQRADYSVEKKKCESKNVDERKSVTDITRLPCKYGTEQATSEISEMNTLRLYKATKYQKLNTDYLFLVTLNPPLSQKNGPMSPCFVVSRPLKPQRTMQWIKRKKSMRRDLWRLQRRLPDFNEC